MKQNNSFFHIFLFTIFTIICSLKIVELYNDINFKEKVIICDFEDQDEIDQNTDFEELGLLVTNMNFHIFYRLLSYNNYLPSFLDESHLISDLFKPPRFF